MDGTTTYNLTASLDATGQPAGGTVVNVSNLSASYSITGSPGVDGIGIPAGGTTGQVYAKNSNTDYDGSFKTLTKTDIGLSNVDNTSDINKPISTLTQTALNAKEPTISSGTTSQYFRGDKTFQTLDKTAVGLSNVDNTSDVNKPVSTAQQITIDAKVADTITDGVTTVAPSQNAVFDALALTVVKGELIFNVKDYGALGNGSNDDTSAFNSAINAAISNGSKNVYVGGGTFMIKANVPGTTSMFFLGDEGGIELKDGITLIMAPGATLQAITTSQDQYNVIRCYNKSNVTIIGGTVRGERNTHTGTTGQWGYGLAITGGSNITVRDTKFQNFWGDGIDLQRIASPLTVPTGVRLYNVVSDGNRRQGMSIEGANDFLAVGCTFKNTGGTGGQAPMAGVDIEPVADGIPVQDIVFDNCRFTNNSGCGVSGLHDGLKNLTINNCLFDGNLDSQSQFKTYVPVGAGTIKLTNCTFRNTPSSAQCILVQGGDNYLVANNTLDQRMFFGAGSTGNRLTNIKITNNKITAPSTYSEPATWILVSNTDRATVLDNDIDATAITSTTATAYRVDGCTSVTIRYGKLSNVPNRVQSVNGTTTLVTIDGHRKVDIAEQSDGFLINTNASVSTFYDMQVNGVSRASIGKVANGDVEFKTAANRNLLLSPGSTGNIVVNSSQIKSVADPTLAQDVATKNYVDTISQPLDATLTAIAAYNTNGLLTQTAADTFVGRVLTGTTNQVVVANGDGVSGNPTFSLPQSIHTGASPSFLGLTIDTNTLSVDSTNHRVGFLTATPTHTSTYGSTSTGITAYNTSDQITNFERARHYWNSNVYTIAIDFGGTGVARALKLFSVGSLTLNTSSTNGFIQSNGTSVTASAIIHLVNGGLNSTSGLQYGLSVAPTVGQSSTAGYTALLVNPTESTTGSGSKLLADLQVGGVSKLAVDNKGKINVPVGGAAATAGTGTLVAGTATISTTAVTANSLIFLQDTAGTITNVGVLTVSSKIAGTSFTVTSTIALDTSTFSWFIIN